MNKFFPIIGLILFFSLGVLAQTKSIADAESEIKTFANFEKYSIAYDATRYVTKTEVSFDILQPKTPLSKLFKKFEFALSTLFATDGIDKKPVRSTLCLNTQSKKFFFSSDRNLTVILDGEDILLGEADRATEVKGSKIRETLCWEIDLELIDEFSRANSFEYKLPNINGNFSGENLQYFKNYAALLKVEKE